jgi:hypothetical protein
MLQNVSEIEKNTLNFPICSSPFLVLQNRVWFFFPQKSKENKSRPNFYLFFKIGVSFRLNLLFLI